MLSSVSSSTVYISVYDRGLHKCKCQYWYLLDSFKIYMVMYDIIKNMYIQNQWSIPSCERKSFIRELFEGPLYLYLLQHINVWVVKGRVHSQYWSRVLTYLRRALNRQIWHLCPTARRILKFKDRYSGLDLICPLYNISLLLESQNINNID